MTSTQNALSVIGIFLTGPAISEFIANHSTVFSIGFATLLIYALTKKRNHHEQP